MNERKTNILEMAVRVQAIYTEKRAALAHIKRAEEQFAILNEALAQLQQMAEKAVSGTNNAKQQTANKTALQEEIEEMLDLIRLTAGSIAITRPGTDEKFPAIKKVGNRALISAVKSALTEAAGMREEFIALGMDQDFIEVLQSKIKAFESSLSTRAKETDSKIAASAETEPLVGKILIAVHYLDTIIRNIFSKDKATIKRWESASHILQPDRPSTNKQKPKPTKPTKPSPSDPSAPPVPNN